MIRIITRRRAHARDDAIDVRAASPHRARDGDAFASSIGAVAGDADDEQGVVDDFLPPRSRDTRCDASRGNAVPSERLRWRSAR